MASSINNRPLLTSLCAQKATAQGDWKGRDADQRRATGSPAALQGRGCINSVINRYILADIADWEVHIV